MAEELKVVLNRSEDASFGFSLLGTSGLPHVIYDIIENSPAAECGVVRHSNIIHIVSIWPFFHSFERNPTQKNTTHPHHCQLYCQIVQFRVDLTIFLLVPRDYFFFPNSMDHLKFDSWKRNVIIYTCVVF